MLPGGDAEFLVEALGRLDHVEFDRVVLVAGIEIDVVLRQPGNRVDCAVIGQFLGARGEPFRVGLAERGLHALIERLRTVLRHGGRPKREDAGSRRSRRRRKARPRRCRRRRCPWRAPPRFVPPCRRPRRAPTRRWRRGRRRAWATRRRRAPHCASASEPSHASERQRGEAAWNHLLHAQFPFGAAPRRRCCFTRDDRAHPARRLLETFSWSFCLMGPKTSCIARTRV